MAPVPADAKARPPTPVSMEPPGSGDPATSALLFVAMLLPFGLIALLRWDYARWERQNPPKKAR